MKTSFQTVSFALVYMIILATLSPAQNFTILYTFSIQNILDNGDIGNSDGAYPNSLILSSSNLYGTAIYGGTNGQGTIFSMNTDGTIFTNLHNFNPSDGSGYNPNSGLLLLSNTLYGTTLNGGSGYGAMFRIKTDGTGYTNLYNFQYGNGTNTGYYPQTGLTVTGNTFYGTTSQGGDWGPGTIFAINTD